MEGSGNLWSRLGAEAMLQQRAVKERRLERLLALSHRQRARSPLPGHLQIGRVVLLRNETRSIEFSAGGERRATGVVHLFSED